MGVSGGWRAIAIVGDRGFKMRTAPVHEGRRKSCGQMRGRDVTEEEGLLGKAASVKRRRLVDETGGVLCYLRNPWRLLQGYSRRQAQLFF